MEGGSRAASTDPWGIPDHLSRTRLRLVRAVVPILLAVVVASLGPVLRLWDFGPQQRRELQLLVVLVALAVAASTLPRWWVRLAGWTLVGAAGVLPPWPAIGRQPVVTAVAVAILAAGSLISWHPWPGHPGRPQRLAPLVVGVLVTSQIAWGRGASTAVALLGVAVALVVLEGYHLRPRWPASIDRAIGRVVAPVANGLARGVLAVVVAPVLWFPGAIAEAVWRRQRSRNLTRSSWRDRTVDVDDLRRDARQPFASAERASRRRQVAAGTVVTVVLVSSFAAYLRTRDPEVVYEAVDPITGQAAQTTVPPEDPAPDALPLVETAAGANQPELAQVEADQRDLPLPPGPVGGYALGDVRSVTTNVESGVRRTVPPQPCDCPERLVWFTGGSAAFGIGQRDDRTVASALVGAAGRRGVGLRVENLAVPGYTLWQEYQGILARLATAADRPDAVVFYDGFNDLSFSLLQTINEGPRFDRPVVFDPLAADDARVADPARILQVIEEVGGPTGLGQLAGERMVKLRRLIDAQLGRMGIRAVFVLQPDAFASPVQIQTVLAEDARYASRPEAETQAFATVLDAAEALLGPGSINLRHAVDGEPGPVFFDLVHMNEDAASVVAEALADELVPTLLAS